MNNNIEAFEVMRRDKLEELLDEYFDLAVEKGRNFERNGLRSNQVRKEILSLFDLASQAQQTESQWISVEERLPEMETPVIAMVGKNIYALARVDYDEGWLWAICGCDLSDIRDYEADDDYQPTHWLPLNIPPAPEGGDK